MQKRKLFSLLVALIFLLFASSAMASYVIDFSIVPDSSDTGMISYDGTNGLVGSNIDVDQVSLLGGGPVHSLTNGILNFNTGDLISYNPSGSIGREWTFGGGGFITITADVDGQTGVVLLDGEWISAKVIELNSAGDLKLEVAVGGFTDEKNKWLLYELGLLDYDPSCYDQFKGPFSGSLNLSFTIIDTDLSETFESCVIGSGDIHNTPVPIPGAVWLLGSGIIGLIGVRRKFRK